MTVALHAAIREFRYAGIDQPALADVDLTVRQGEFVVVTGPAGSGKTTLCYCLAGVIPKSVQGHFTGEVTVAGQRLTGLSLPQVSPHVGLVMQTPENQLFSVTVGEDVAFGPENLRLPKAEVEARVRRYLEFTGTAHLRERFSHLLSGGQSQRVVLSSALAMEAGTYIFDQPAGELDPAGRRFIYENICKLNREAGKTIVLVEDRLSDVVAFATRIVLLSEGRVIRDLPTREFLADRSLEAYGLRIPDAVRLYHALADEGVALKRIPLSVQEAVEQIEAEVPVEPEARVTAEGSAPEAAGAAEGPAAVEVRGLVHRYATGVEALTGIDLTVRQGEFLAIVGENGAGKSTLAKHLIGLLRPTQGSVRVMGEDLSKLAIHRISQWVGFLFQDPDYQIFNNSCLEEVAYGLNLRRLPPGQVRAQAMAALDRLGLAEHWDAHPYTLSRGQRQRLAVASVFANKPPILMVDEPSTGLDYRESMAMIQLLQEYRAAGGTVMIITHDMGIATQFAERIVMISGGRIRLDVPARRIQEHLADLEGSAIMLPDVAMIVRRLGLPPSLRTVEELAAALAGMAPAREEAI